MRAIRRLRTALLLLALGGLVVGCAKRRGEDRSEAAPEPAPGQTPSVTRPPAPKLPPEASAKAPAEPKDEPTAKGSDPRAGIMAILALPAVPPDEKEFPKPGAPAEPVRVEPPPPVKVPDKVVPEAPADPPTPKPAAPPKPPSEVGGKKLSEWKWDLQHSDASVRVEAIMAIPHFGEASADAVSALIGATRDTEVTPRTKAVIALRFVAIDEKDVDKVVKALGQRVSGDNQTIIRYEAVSTLHRFGKEAAPVIPDLVQGAKDRYSYSIRHACVALLWRVCVASKGPPDPRAVRALLTAMKDPTSAVRLEAIKGLGAMGPPSESDLLQQMYAQLKTVSVSSSNTSLQIWAHTSLVGLEDKSAEASVAVVARFLTHKTLRVRCEAAQAVGVMGDKAKKQVPKLLKMLEDKQPLAAHAACVALASIGDNGTPVIDALIGLLDHDEVACVVGACGALGQLGGANPKVIPALEKQLKRDDLHDGLRPVVKATIEHLKSPKKAKK